MKRTSVTAGTFLLALALCGSGATSASAVEAHIGRCVKVGAGSGSFTDSNCLDKVEEKTGEYEWEELAKGKFTGTAGSVTPFATSAGKVTCKEAAIEGEVAKAGDNATLNLKSCEVPSSKVKCKTEGDAAGVILAKPTFTALTYESKGEIKTGIALKLPEALSLTCGVLKIMAKGSVTGTITPEDAMSSSFTLTFKTTEGKQEIKSESPLEANFGIGYEAATAEGEYKLTFEEQAVVNPPWLRLQMLNVGGVPTFNTRKCKFALKLEICMIEVKNLSIFRVTIKRSEVAGFEAGARYVLKNNTCTVNAKLEGEPPAGGTCTVEAQLIKDVGVGEKWANAYQVEIEAPNGMKLTEMVLLEAG